MPTEALLTARWRRRRVSSRDCAAWALWPRGTFSDPRRWPTSELAVGVAVLESFPPGATGYGECFFFVCVVEICWCCFDVSLMFWCCWYFDVCDVCDVSPFFFTFVIVLMFWCLWCFDVLICWYLIHSIFLTVRSYSILYFFDILFLPSAILSCSALLCVFVVFFVGGTACNARRTYAHTTRHKTQQISLWPRI